jgi:4-hydroxy-3-methylbut-2-enyl diphosphate reductase
MFRAAILDRYGAADLTQRFRAFDTILQRHAGPAGRGRRAARGAALDLMLVVGGYNSSNTCNLARMCDPKLPTFHIRDPGRPRLASEIRHKPVGESEETRRGRLAALDGPVAIGLTSGASTPDNLVETGASAPDDAHQSSVTSSPPALRLVWRSVPFRGGGVIAGVTGRNPCCE